MYAQAGFHGAAVPEAAEHEIVRAQQVTPPPCILVKAQLSHALRRSRSPRWSRQAQGGIHQTSPPPQRTRGREHHQGAPPHEGTSPMFPLHPHVTWSHQPEAHSVYRPETGSPDHPEQTGHQICPTSGCDAHRTHGQSRSGPLQTQSLMSSELSQQQVQQV